jgi:hypothetical protein
MTVAAQFFGAGDDMIDELARLLWGAPDPYTQLRRPAHGFPSGHLLGRARVDGGLAEPVLGARLRIAVTLTDRDIDAILAARQDADGIE